MCACVSLCVCSEMYVLRTRLFSPRLSTRERGICYKIAAVGNCEASNGTEDTTVDLTMTPRRRRNRFSGVFI